MTHQHFHRFFREPPTSYFLLGPRGTGKSTWVMRHHHEAVRVDFLQPETLRLYHSRPERLRDLVYGNRKQKTFILDEIQRVPEILPLVHSLIEEKQGWQFILTGSSARKLRKAGVDLLAGRALMLSMHPLMAGEMEGSFVLEEALRSGTLPLVIDSASPDEVLAAYTMTYLQEEVQAEGLVRNIGNFSRFLEVISFSHASLLNMSNVAREAEVERKMVEGYIGILEDLLLAYRLPVFSRRAKRQLSQHPKFYLFDAGVYRSLRPQGPMDREEEINGQALEGLVGQHLRAWIGYGNGRHTLSFWRTRRGVEVDFVLYGETCFIALEVKNNKKVFAKDVQGLKSFQSDYPESQVALLYRGTEKVEIQGIPCLPVQDFLLSLDPSRPPNTLA